MVTVLACSSFRYCLERKLLREREAKVLKANDALRISTSLGFRGRTEGAELQSNFTSHVNPAGAVLQVNELDLPRTKAQSPLPKT